MEEVVVFVPARGSHISAYIDAGSAIVARASDLGERTRIYYEGNRYGAASMQTYGGRVQIAAGRSLEHAPTIAMASVANKELVRVGIWDHETGEVRLDDHESQARLLAYLGLAVMSDADLQGSGYRYEIRRELAAMRASGDPSQRAAADFYERRLIRD